MANEQQAISNIIKVVGVTATGGAVKVAVNIGDVNNILTTISVSLAIAYGVWRWLKDIKESKKKNETNLQ
tara:strand:+ start:798 stop:1007 length:210 start_codon:yes stop_codon:yes gene_type:complete